MSFMEDLINEMNKVPLYEVVDKDKPIKTIECSVVCDIITVLLDKYGIGESNDLHG